MGDLQRLFKEISELKEIIATQAIYQKEILSFKEACIFLNLKDNFLYKLTSGNVITHYVPNGKMIYFRKADLVDYLLRYKVRSNDEIESETEAYLGNSKLKRIR